MTTSAAVSRIRECAAGAPLFTSAVAAGFPSPAEEEAAERLDLNDLIEHPASTFFVRALGDSMEGDGIYSGDLLVVDRAVEARDGAIALAVLDGEFTVKRLRLRADRPPLLVPSNPRYPPIEVDEGSTFEVWGVVVWCIRDTR